MTEGDRKSQALPYVLVGAGALVLFLPMLISGRVLFWGTPLLQFVPWRTYALETLRQGHLPLWNSLVGMGAPLLANYQSALLYPPNWILPVIGIEWGQGLLVMLHLMLAGCGMALLAKRLGSSLLGQTLSGLAFGLSGYLVARAGFLSINATAAWLPWLVLCADRLVFHVVNHNPRREVGKAMLWLAIALAMQWLAGHAQTAWYSLILVGVWAVYRAVVAAGWRGLLRLVPWILAAGVLAFALSALQLIPTLEYMVNSQRAEMLDPEFAMTYSFAPWRSLGLLFPDLFGNPARGDYWGYGNYWEDAIYVGVIPLLFSLYALMRGIAGRDERKKLIRVLGLITLIAFIFALGKNTPIFPWLYEHIPSFDLFQAPARWNLIPVFALALLAAFGVDAWRAPMGRTLYWLRLATAGAAMVALTAFLLGALNPSIRQTFTRTFMMAGAWLFAFCLVALFRPDKLTLTWVAGIGLVVLIDLTLANWGLNPSQPRSIYSQASELATQLGMDHRVYMAADLEHEIKFEQTHRFDTFEPEIGWDVVREAGLPNSISLDGIPSANNFDPLVPERYSTWMQELEGLELERLRQYLALMDVGWYAVEDSLSLSGVGYEAVDSPARARLVYDAIYEPTADRTLESVFADSFNPSRSVVLEGTREISDLGIGEGKVLSIEQDGPGDVTIEIISSHDTWLVLSDTWYPGWHAEIDGEKTEIQPANYLFRGVRVPAGEHAITFTYRPLSAIVGFSLSCLGLLALTGMALLWRRD